MIIHVGLLAGSAGLAAASGSPLGLLLYPAVFVANEIADVLCNVSIWDHTTCVRRSYEWFDIFLDDPAALRIDLSEGLFEGQDKPVEQAVRDKYDFILDALGLRAGDRLLDIGCGYGQFVQHAAAKGICARGLTLSPQQAAAARAQGADVICADGRDPPPELLGQFDAVTYLGCIEHFCESGHVYQREREEETLRQVFRTAHRLLDPASPRRRIFTATLHRLSRPWSAWDWISGYLMMRHYGGLYPQGDDGLIKNRGSLFEVIGRWDRTEDYRVTSLKDPQHFGDFRIRWTPARAARALGLLLVDPYALHKWAYHLLGVWMWQFGGRTGLPPDQQLTRLWWFAYEAAG
jgi:cyclopropane-fatty-acyl-phospholipid synthase